MLDKLRELLGGKPPSDTNGRDPEVRATVLDAAQHVRTSRRLHKEIKAVQVKLERSSHSGRQGGLGWNSTRSSH